MKEIVISEGCFGPDISINNESLFIHEYDSRPEEYVYQLKLILVTELIKNVNNLSIYDLISIGEMIVNNSNEWELCEDNSNENTCDQCGNWNYTNTFKKIKYLDYNGRSV